MSAMRERRIGLRSIALTAADDATMRALIAYFATFALTETR
jgi:hypothetical protein